MFIANNGKLPMLLVYTYPDEIGTNGNFLCIVFHPLPAEHQTNAIILHSHILSQGTSSLNLCVSHGLTRPHTLHSGPGPAKQNSRIQFSLHFFQC